jgi:hypothetical protein
VLGEVDFQTMADRIAERSWGAKLTPYIPWLTVCVVATAALYLFGYWSTFHVNILEYVGFQDLVTAAALPLLKVVAFTVVGCVVTQIVWPKVLRYISGVIPFLGRLVNQHWTQLLLQYVIVAILVSWLSPREAEDSLLLPKASAQSHR